MPVKFPTSDGHSKSQGSFILSILLFLIVLTTLGIWNHTQYQPLRQSPIGWPAYSELKLESRSLDGMEKAECRLVHEATDKCNFVMRNCFDEEPGLVSYLQLYYCRLAGAKPVAFTIMVLWLGLLFSTIGIAASDFFCINLNTISILFGLSESLAGVTILAFGNGSPDVFSTFAAMNTHSGSLAVGELIGAASFITAIVSGSMAIVRPFKVAKTTFVRDISFFIVAASFSLGFLADGHLTLLESALMVIFYVLYVVTVVTWHWVVGRKDQSRKREAVARTQFSDENVDDSEMEVQGDDNEHFETDPRPQNNAPEISVEFRGIETGAESGIEQEHQWEDQVSGDLRTSEFRGGMRLSRSISVMRRNTGNSIRPSLLGALEFTAVLSSLQRSQSQQALPAYFRRYSDDPTSHLHQQQGYTPQLRRGSESDQRANRLNVRGADENDMGNRHGRNRAASMNDSKYLGPSGTGPSWISHSNEAVSSSLSSSEASRDLHPSQMHHTAQSSAESSHFDHEDHPEAQTASTAPDFLEAPRSFPDIDFRTSPLSTDPGRTSGTVNNGYSVIDSPRQTYDVPDSRSMLLPPDGADPSPGVPFPPYLDDPSSHPPFTRRSSFQFSSTPSNIGSPELEPIFVEQGQQCPSWWPSGILPPPWILLATLFPTLHGWKRKNYWERTLGIISAPSIFLLTITLPVAEADGIEQRGAKLPLDVARASPSDATLVPEPPLNSNSPPLIILNAPSETQNMAGNDVECPQEHRLDDGTDIIPSHERVLVHKPDQTTPSKHRLAEPHVVNGNKSMNPSKHWNRWLLSTQIFIGPFFFIVMMWTSFSDNHSGRQLLIAAAGGLIGSLIAYAGLLLTTSADKPPRYRHIICFLGFVLSITWISTIANEVVGLLKAFGVILGIGDAILGLTVFAIGNSLGDLVANITMAKLGFPVMALSACFGGPMLNILLGIGLSGLYITIKESREYDEQHPGRMKRYNSYELEVGGTLLVSGATLLITLIGLLVAVPMNNWVMDRRLGWGLICLWSASTLLNIVIEGAGITGHHPISFR